LNNTPDLPLVGRGIVITRPLDQAQILADLVRQSGGKPILFPLLEIVPLQDYGDFDAVIDRLDAFDWAIFISSNAVQHGMSRLLARRKLPQGLRYAAIGPVTANELGDFGVHEVLTPADRFDSESLLNLPEMWAVAGKRCVIFRGVGGRDLLAKTLVERGSEVVFAECYQRTNPSLDHAWLAHLWESDHLQAVVVTSSEALRNLLNLASDAAWLKNTPIFVNHPRIAEAADAQGLQAILASAPGDPGMLATLETYFNRSS
jgi:uroporphyrinogen-III synthase